MFFIGQLTKECEIVYIYVYIYIDNIEPEKVKRWMSWKFMRNGEFGCSDILLRIENWNEE